MTSHNNNNYFHAFFPITSMTKSDSGTGEMRIAGIASTASPDRQGDIIPQEVLDISEFLEHGFLNYDHNNEKILGYPDKTKTKFTNEGLYVEGVLLSGIPLAEEVYHTAKALQDSGSDRRYGFSVEGFIQERDSTNPKIVRKAKVTNLAITPTPVNKECTWEVVKKSLMTRSPVELPSVVIKENLEKRLVTLDTPVSYERSTAEGIVLSLLSMKAAGSSGHEIEGIFRHLVSVSPDITFLESQALVIQSLITGETVESLLINRR